MGSKFLATLPGEYAGMKIKVKVLEDGTEDWYKGNQKRPFTRVSPGTYFALSDLSKISTITWSHPDGSVHGIRLYGGKIVEAFFYNGRK